MDPRVIFLDLIELQDQTATTIVNKLLELLDANGFSDEYLKENLVAFASDGASAMIGSNSGVAVQLQAKYHDCIIWHCLNHRLELAVNDVIVEMKCINHFESFIGKIYSIYSCSPKNLAALREHGVSLDIRILKIGKVFDVRYDI
jgi:hypothetical protein